MKNNTESLKQIKAEIVKKNNSKFISQEAMVELLHFTSGVSTKDIYRVMLAMQDVTVNRFNNGQDVLIPGIMRIVPGEGGLTRRYIKIQSVSEKLKGRLK